MFIIRVDIAVRATLLEIRVVVNIFLQACLWRIVATRATVFLKTGGDAGALTTNDLALSVPVNEFRGAMSIKIGTAARSMTPLRGVNVHRDIKAVDNGYVVPVLARRERPLGQSSRWNTRTTLPRALQAPVASTSLALQRAGNLLAEVTPGTAPNATARPVARHLEGLMATRSKLEASIYLRLGKARWREYRRPDSVLAIVVDSNCTVGHGGQRQCDQGKKNREQHLDVESR